MGCALRAAIGDDGEAAVQGLATGHRQSGSYLPRFESVPTVTMDTLAVHLAVWPVVDVIVGLTAIFASAGNTLGIQHAAKLIDQSEAHVHTTATNDNAIVLPKAPAAGFCSHAGQPPDVAVFDEVQANLSRHTRRGDVFHVVENSLARLDPFADGVAGVENVLRGRFRFRHGLTALQLAIVSVSAPAGSVV